MSPLRKTSLKRELAPMKNLTEQSLPVLLNHGDP